MLVVAGTAGRVAAGARRLLPATLAGAVDRSRGAPGALGGLEYGHAVFEPFRAPRSGDFSAARFYGYRSVTPAKDAQVLARFDDGAAGAGRADRRPRPRAGVDLDARPAWNDLALKPVFLPFVHQMARHLADYRERPLGHGRPGDRPARQAGDPAAATAGARLAAVRQARRRSTGDQRRVLELTEQGFYEVREPARTGRRMVVAGNVELAESDSDRGRSRGNCGGGDRRPRRRRRRRRRRRAACRDEAQEQSQRLWWYLLFAGILLLTAESLLAHRLSTARRVDEHGRRHARPDEVVDADR